MKAITRREFLRYFGVGSLGLLVNPKIPLSLNHGGRASDVIQCFDENATTGSTINESIVQMMMDASIKRLTGMTTVGNSWKSVFPGITQSSIIGIKVNCLFPITTSRELAGCIANGLSQMDFSGTPYYKNNIIIWDNSDSLLSGNGGYTIYDGSDPDTVRCFGTDHSGVGYDYSNPFNVNGVTSYPSRILTEFCDYIVDAAVLKDHSISQITLTLKNNYGSVSNPGSLHGGQCNPYIPSLNQQIRDVITPNDKQKIFIVDCLFGCYNGGPGGGINYNPKMLLMSQDMVACDYQGQNLINEERAAHGLGQLDAPHITTAAQPPYNLGTTDVNLIEINNPSSVNDSKTNTPRNGMLRIAPNPFRRETAISFALERTSYVYLDLINASGAVVSPLYRGQRAAGSHRIRCTVNNKVSSGTYFVRLYGCGIDVVTKVSILD